MVGHEIVQRPVLYATERRGALDGRLFLYLSYLFALGDLSGVICIPQGKKVV